MGRLATVQARRALDGLLLDVGGPMLRMPFEFVADIERGLAIAPGSITGRGPFAPGTDPLWRECEAGRVSDREYWRQWAGAVQRLAGGSQDVAEFFVDCFRHAGDGPVRKEMVAVVTDARAAGLKVGALTNDAAFLLPGFLDDLPVFSAFDAVIDLSYAGVRKPDRRAFAIGVEALGVRAGRVLFVDDQAVNVAGAEAAGLRGLRFDVTDVAGSVLKIRERLRES